MNNRGAGILAILIVLSALTSFGVFLSKTDSWWVLLSVASAAVYGVIAGLWCNERWSK